MRVYAVFTSGKGVFARGIEAVTGGDVNHSLTLYKSVELDAWMIMQAEVGRGFIVRPAVPYLKDKGENWFRYAYDMGPEGQRYLRKLAERLPDPYDGLGIGMWFFAALGNRIAKKERWFPRWRNEGSSYCSEAMSWALRQFNTPGILDDRYNPAQLRLLFDRCELFQRVDPASLYGEVLQVGQG